MAYPEGFIFEDDPDYDDGGYGSYDDGYGSDGYDDGDRYDDGGREDDFYDAYRDGG